MSLEFHVSLKFQVSPKLHISLWSFGAPQILWILGVWHFSGAIVLSACWTFGLVALDDELEGATLRVPASTWAPEVGHLEVLVLEPGGRKSNAAGLH